MHKENIQELNKHFISEHDYFEYYQNANDPTFEMYEYVIKEFIETPEMEKWEWDLSV